jgi:hypothetical protein
MNVRGVVKSIQKGLLFYKDFLSEIPKDQFERLPASGGWSFAQLYSHILYVNQLSLISIERCINHTAVQDKRHSDWRVWLILLVGKLPPGRIKAPDRIAGKVSQIEKKEARNQLLKFSERLEDICRKIHKAPRDQKISHPRLGPLNAKQWLRFIDIHTRHHIPQLNRIRSAISV